jgi:hypothetical protein
MEDDNEVDIIPELGGQDVLADNMPEARIWGTEVNVQTCRNVFCTFIDFFRVSPSDALPFYRKELQRLADAPMESVLNLNCTHLLDFPSSR